MAKARMNQRVIQTPMRGRIARKLGGSRLKELEVLVMGQGRRPQEVIDTPARARLRKKIGKEALERIEARILNGEQ